MGRSQELNLGLHSKFDSVFMVVLACTSLSLFTGTVLGYRVSDVWGRTLLLLLLMQNVLPCRWLCCASHGPHPPTTMAVDD